MSGSVKAVGKFNKQIQKLIVENFSAVVKAIQDDNVIYPEKYTIISTYIFALSKKFKCTL